MSPSGHVIGARIVKAIEHKRVFHEGINPGPQPDGDAADDSTALPLFGENMQLESAATEAQRPTLESAPCWTPETLATVGLTQASFYGNHRVLIWNTLPDSGDAAPDDAGLGRRAAHIEAEHFGEV